jgi:hypothetical protein
VNAANTPQGRAWSTMGRADFDQGAPLALVDEGAVSRSVLAVPDAYGTDALFGEAPRSVRSTRTRTPAEPPADDTATLF